MRESWNRLETFWLVEALGQVERDGYFEDNEVLGCLAQNATLLEANDEELVVRRAQELSVRHPRVIRLRTNIGHLVTSARHLLTVCIFVSLVAGMSAASAIFGAGNSINIVTAWIALVGVNLLSLVLTVSLVLAAPGKMQFSLPGAWLWLLGRVGRKYNAPLLLRSLGTLVARTGKIGAFLTNFSHIFWITITAGAVFACLSFFLFRQYAFVWETTILPKGFFVGFTDLVGRLPCMVDLFSPCPSAADVIDLADSDDTRKAWTRWLLGSIIVYGLLPRLVALAASFWSTRRSIDRLSVDITIPYYFLLAKRIRDRIAPGDEIVDPDPGNITPTGAPPSSQEPDPPRQILGAIIPYEVRNLQDIDPTSFKSPVSLAKNVRTYADQQHALQMLSTAPVFNNLLFIADAGVSADRGAFQFLRQVRERTTNLKVALLGQSDARKDKLENWLEGLAEMGIANQDVFSQLEPALNWLATQGGNSS
jgi:hypothetical protein